MTKHNETLFNVSYEKEREVMKKHIVKTLGMVLILLTLAGCGAEEMEVQGEEPRDGVTLTVYCGAGLKNIFTEIGNNYQASTGVKIDFIFNGSGMLMEQIQTTGIGDLFIPGERSFIDQLVAKTGEAVIGEEALFENVPVILLHTSAEEQITSLEDLAKEGCDLGLGDDTIAIGKLFNKVLVKNGLKEKVDANTIVRFATVNQVVSAVEMGQVDAGVAFYLNYVDCDHDLVKMVEITEEQNVTQNVSVAVLGSSKQEAAALAFMAYVKDEGCDVFERYTYK